MSEIAQKAEFYALGIVAGICEKDEAIRWAVEVINHLDHPSTEIIEVAGSQSRDEVLDALNRITENGNSKKAGAKLLARIYDQMAQTLYPPMVAAMTAVKVAQIAELPDHIYYDLVLVEDEMRLAKSEVYSSVDECAKNLMSILKQHGDFS